MSKPAIKVWKDSDGDLCLGFLNPTIIETDDGLMPAVCIGGGYAEDLIQAIKKAIGE